MRPQPLDRIEARARRASGIALLGLAGAAPLGGVTAQAETVRNDLCVAKGAVRTAVLSGNTLSYAGGYLPGLHQVQPNTSALFSGVYLVALRAGERADSRKLVVIH